MADSLLAALDHGRSLRDDDALRPWLLRIATNKALRYRQRAAHVVELQVVEGAVAEPRGPTADDSLALWQAVRDLPPRMRAAIGLRYYLDLPVETVAEVLDVSPNTIKTQLKSALAHLRQPSPTNPCPSRRCGMRDLDDTALELRLREVLNEHLGALPLELTVETLDRRREARGVARRFGRGRGMTLLAAAAAVLLVGGALAGSGLLQRPSVVPPVPAPSFAQVAIASPDATPTHTPTPTASDSPPTPVSLKLAWTKVALDEKSPRVAWVGDRFVLADMESGAVRTSTDGTSWQALQPGDAAPGYVHLLGGSLAGWQDTAVGLWHPQDGPDISGAPPITARDVFTIVHPPAAPISTTPFRGRIESIGIGPKGIVAEVHSVLDPDTNPSNDWGFGWYSPNGEHWTQMARRTDLSDLPGARLPTGAFGQVVGVSDGFIATGGCARADDFCSGMWFSSDGLTWRFLGTYPSADLIPWMGGALVINGPGHFDLWTSRGSTRLSIAADLEGTVGMGPAGLVIVSWHDQKALVSRDGIDFGIGPIPTQMAGASSRNWGPGAPTVAVGDRHILALARDDLSNYPRYTWSLWLGTLEP